MQFRLQHDDAMDVEENILIEFPSEKSWKRKFGNIKFTKFWVTIKD